MRCGITANEMLDKILYGSKKDEFVDVFMTAANRGPVCSYCSVTDLIPLSSPGEALYKYNPKRQIMIKDELQLTLQDKRLFMVAEGNTIEGLEVVRDIKEEFEHLRTILDRINSETKPIDGHSDPKALKDCWEEVYTILNEIEKSIDDSSRAG